MSTTLTHTRQDLKEKKTCKSLKVSSLITLKDTCNLLFAEHFSFNILKSSSHKLFQKLAPELFMQKLFSRLRAKSVKHLYSIQKRGLTLAIRFLPGHASIYARIGDFYYKRSADKAIQFYSKALNFKQNNPNIHTKIGELYTSQYNYPLAQKHFQKAILLNPSETKNYLKLGEVYLLTSQSIKADRLFKKAISLDIKNTETYIKVARYYLMHCFYSMTLEYILKSLEIEPENIDLIKMTADAYYYLYDYERAISYYYKALLISKEKCALTYEKIASA